MPRTKLVFYGTERSETDTFELVCIRSVHNEIFISIEDGEGIEFISLDKQTAIKLHRELKKQISFITDNEN